MVPSRSWWPVAVLLVGMLRLPASAQTLQFLPEIDIFANLAPSAQFWFQAKDTREDGAPTQAEIGPSLDFYVKPLVKLKTVAGFNLDESKQRLLVFSVGYRYLPSPGNPSVNRLLLMATANLPFKGGMLVSDRNRLEVNHTNGNPSWRYRNRLTLQRTVGVDSYHLSPYASAEFYYNSQYDKWSTTSIDAGCIFPLGRKTEINPYYEHQNNTGPSPNQQVNAFGLILNIYLWRERR